MTDPNKPPIDKTKQNRNLLLAVGAVVLVGIVFTYRMANVDQPYKSTAPAVNPALSTVVTPAPMPALDINFAITSCKAPLIAKYKKSFDQSTANTDNDRTGISLGHFIWYTTDFKCTVDSAGRAVVSTFSDEEVKSRLNKDCFSTAREAGYNDPTYSFTKPKILKNKNGYILTARYGGQAFQCTSYDPSPYRAEFLGNGVDYFIGREGEKQRRQEAASADLLIKSWRCNLDGDYMKFVGEVTNQTSEAMSNIEAVGNVYDKDGLVDTSEALIDYHNLRPGETSPFSTLVDTGGRGNNCRISFKTFDGTVINSAEVPE